MATKFQKGDVVKLKAVPPQGPVQAMRMLEDGTVQCLVAWTDAQGNEQERWFDEDELTGE